MMRASAHVALPAVESMPERAPRVELPSRRAQRVDPPSKPEPVPQPMPEPTIEPAVAAPLGRAPVMEVQPAPVAVSFDEAEDGAIDWRRTGTIAAAVVGAVGLVGAFAGWRAGNEIEPQPAEQKLILPAPTNAVPADAATEALKYDSSVLIEEFIEGKEYRFHVIGDEVAAILHRVPANVTGDGIHTIEELVAEKNKNPLRGKGYVTPLEKLALGTVETEYLALSGRDITFVPQKGETVYLRENSNISTGGDSIDFTDIISEDYKQIAVRAARAVGAKICGADIIIRSIGDKPEINNYAVIELNFNPALHIHDFPFQGENRRVEKKVLDLLGF
jgi:hypothetical protein